MFPYLVHGLTLCFSTRKSNTLKTHAGLCALVDVHQRERNPWSRSLRREIEVSSSCSFSFIFFLSSKKSLQEDHKSWWLILIPWVLGVLDTRLLSLHAERLVALFFLETFFNLHAWISIPGAFTGNKRRRKKCTLSLKEFEQWCKSISMISLPFTVGLGIHLLPDSSTLFYSELKEKNERSCYPNLTTKAVSFHGNLHCKTDAFFRLTDNEGSFVLSDPFIIHV